MFLQKTMLCLLMEITYLYRVMCVVDGCSEMHSEQYETFEDALKEATHLSDCFPDICYHVEQYEHKWFSEARQYNNNAVDGWEDMFRNRDF